MRAFLFLLLLSTSAFAQQAQIQPFDERVANQIGALYVVTQRQVEQITTLQKDLDAAKAKLKEYEDKEKANGK